MRSHDFTPYLRSSVGFDRMLDLLGAPQRQEPEAEGPAYDIERVGEDRYRITIATPGFAEHELSIMAEPNALLVEGLKQDEDTKRQFLHRGITQRAFRRQFDLADFVMVRGASYEHGILTVDLEREIPEAMKPRRIEIGAAPSRGSKHRVADRAAQDAA